MPPTFVLSQDQTLQMCLLSALAGGICWIQSAVLSGMTQKTRPDDHKPPRSSRPEFACGRLWARVWVTPVTALTHPFNKAIICYRFVKDRVEVGLLADQPTCTELDRACGRTIQKTSRRSGIAGGLSVSSLRRRVCSGRGILKRIVRGVNHPREKKGESTPHPPSAAVFVKCRATGRVPQAH